MNAAEQFQPLLEGIESGLKSLLEEVLEDGSADLEGPIREIAPRLALAARRGRPDLVAACKDQLSLIVLERDLQIRSGWDSLWAKMLDLGIDLLLSGAAGALASHRR